MRVTTYSIAILCSVQYLLILSVHVSVFPSSISFCFNFQSLEVVDRSGSGDRKLSGLTKMM